MKKIGIVTLYTNNNIGNKLQNFAVQEILKKMGTEPKTLIGDLEKKDFVLSKKRVKLFLKDVLSSLGIKSMGLKNYALDMKREKRFKIFSDECLILGEKINIYSFPLNIQDKYDYFVVGSDQVWHNWTETEEEMKYFFLQFAEKNKRICISPSFGMDTLKTKYKDMYQKGLQGFLKLSCREESGIVLIRDLIGKEAELLIDPTMMLTDEEWLTLAKRPKYFLKKKFLLVYLLGNESEYYKNIIEKIAYENELQVINILDVAESMYYLTEPREFLYLVKHAQMICTDSFHGCVFSILFHTNFLCFERIGSNAENMGNRLETLLRKFNLENRFWKNISPDNLFSISFENADKVLTEEREKFSRYLYDVFKENY